jgi:hypothetical protein
MPETSPQEVLRTRDDFDCTMDFVEYIFSQNDKGEAGLADGDG